MQSYREFLIEKAVELTHEMEIDFTVSDEEALVTYLYECAIREIELEIHNILGINVNQSCERNRYVRET